MDVKQEQNRIDSLDSFIKTDPEIGSSKTQQTKYCPEKSQTFNKEQEFVNTNYVKVTDIKQEVSEFIQSKNESEVSEMLTSHCDLPIMKIDVTDDNPDSSRRRNSSKLLKIKRIYPCFICRKYFPSSKSRSAHTDGHFKKGCRVCPLCGKLMTKKELFRHFFVHVVKKKSENYINDRPLKCNLFSRELKQKNIDDKSLKCLTCFKIFNLKWNLPRHLVIHKKSFKCDTCSKSFNDKFILPLVKDSDQKPFKCNICSKRFSRNGNLHKHLLIHSDEKSFKCNNCPKGFNCKFNLREHSIVLNGTKPFKCNICFKGFNFEHALQKHLINHSVEKSFKCNICFKGFNFEHELQKHLIIHSVKKPFKCNICSKGYNFEHELQKHLIIHRLEKQFKCNVCSKAFVYGFNLQKHLTTHRDEKQFTCEFCFKSFDEKSTLRKHLIIIHSDEKPLSVALVLKYLI